MRYHFRSKALEALVTKDDPAWSDSVIQRFRSRFNLILNAPDERDLRALKSAHFEQLKGNRSHQHSMRLNGQFRLILEFVGSGADKVVHIVDIEDYH